MEWEKLYSKLEEITSGLKPTDSSLESLTESIHSAIKAESQLTLVFIRMSKLYAEAKQTASALKATNALETSEAARSKYNKEVEVRDRLSVFLACVKQGLSLTKHFREDINKQIRILDVQREVTPT